MTSPLFQPRLVWVAALAAALPVSAGTGLQLTVPPGANVHLSVVPANLLKISGEASGKVKDTSVKNDAGKALGSTAGALLTWGTYSLDLKWTKTGLVWLRMVPVDAAVKDIAYYVQVAPGGTFSSPAFDPGMVRISSVSDKVPKDSPSPAEAKGILVTPTSITFK